MDDEKSRADDARTVHPLLTHLLAAAEGRFAPVDGGCTVLPSLPGGLACSVAFTGHAFVASAHSAEDVLARGADGFGGSLAPDFLRWLAGPTGWIDVVDATLVARGTGGPGLPARTDVEGHPRVQHARSLRRDVRVYGDERGLVTLASGLAGRTELGIEAAPEGQGRGWGRALLRDALGLVPAGEPVFAGVAPGNARSLRAFLAVGFVPLGSEVTIRPGQ
ncbi:GNAT family N-acetyltransferase [Phytohabitans houttuyneae]|uniref:N-acetyltransferase n=1 Tax=Phytohabitans houttuyneae TaxID=1076126 RepID=A0A6V8K394_9ACTN|nr:N-acetyltransferase [Phytohabitans houttuyneae]